MLTDCTLMGFIPTTDAERAKAFYRDVLGLKFAHDNGFAMVFHAPHGSSVRLARVPAFTPYPFTLLGWTVDDVTAEVKVLNAAGVVFERYPWAEQDELGIWTTPTGGKVAWFRDPDGNNLSIAQEA